MRKTRNFTELDRDDHTCAVNLKETSCFEEKFGLPKIHSDVKETILPFPGHAETMFSSMKHQAGEEMPGSDPGSHGGFNYERHFYAMREIKRR